MLHFLKIASYNISVFWLHTVLCLVTQLCLSLCGSVDYIPPGSSVSRDSLGNNTGVVCHVLLQGIFPIQGTNPGVPHAGRFFTSWISEAHFGYLWSEVKWSEVKVKVAQSCPTLSNSMDWIVHGILQASVLEWVAVPFSRGSSKPRDLTQVSHIAGRIFTSWATREAQAYWSG